MAHRSTPNTTTGYTHLFFLQGTEITLPSNENLKDKIPKTDRKSSDQIEKLKASLKQA